MTRTAIITDIVACLRAMGPAHGHSLAARQVLRGIHLASELSEKPALCLFNEKVQTADSTSQSAERTLVLRLWGAINAKGGDYGQLDALAASCLLALADPTLNPHAARTSLGDIEFYEGGAGDPLGIFDMELRVCYETPLAIL